MVLKSYIRYYVLIKVKYINGKLGKSKIWDTVPYDVTHP